MYSKYLCKISESSQDTVLCAPVGTTGVLGRINRCLYRYRFMRPTGADFSDKYKYAPPGAAMVGQCPSLGRPTCAAMDLKSFCNINNAGCWKCYLLLAIIIGAGNSHIFY